MDSSDAAGEQRRASPLPMQGAALSPQPQRSRQGSSREGSSSATAAPPGRRQSAGRRPLRRHGQRFRRRNLSQQDGSPRVGEARDAGHAGCWAMEAASAVVLTADSVCVIPGRREAANPESITTANDYGFRAPSRSLSSGRPKAGPVGSGPRMTAERVHEASESQP
jgi:hypothetical protein